jgi:hypothetical protein
MLPTWSELWRSRAKYCQREDAAADRDARLPLVPRLLPGLPVVLDLLGLLDVEGLAALIIL